MHILYIVGNRPQFIKLAVLHREMKKFPFVKETIIHTGQHFSADMSDIFFTELSIDLPITNLGIHSLSHIAMIGQTMEALEIKIKEMAPSFIVVFGDTNATLAGALTGKKLNLPVVHIEAGIRTFDEEMPEESNRYLTDRIAALNFCCTYLGVQHLEREGFNQNGIASKVINSGDLMLDAFVAFKNLSTNGVTEKINPILEEWAFVLCTLHRKQNIENVFLLSQIIQALNRINKELPVVCPLHPYTRQIMEKQKILVEFTTLPPQGYVTMQKLLSTCKYVITDSGGLQREAFFAQKPTLIVMEKPFWPEVMEHGNALCCKSETNAILSQFAALKTLNNSYNVSVFGNGRSAAIIANELIAYFHG